MTDTTEPDPQFIIPLAHEMADAYSIDQLAAMGYKYLDLRDKGKFKPDGTRIVPYWHTDTPEDHDLDTLLDIVCIARLFKKRVVARS